MAIQAPAPDRPACSEQPAPGSSRRATLISTLVALGLGALVAVSFEPVAWPYAAPVAIAGLSLTLTGTTPITAMWQTSVFGLSYMLTTLSWLGASIGAGAWIALSLSQSLWFLPLGWGLVIVRRLPGWPLWSAALWSAIEILRGSWPLGGFPWGRLGMATIDTPWAALLPLFGIPGSGFVVALLGFLAAALIDGCMTDRAAARRTVAIFAAVIAFSVLPAVFDKPIETSRLVTVAVVQGGVPGDGTDLVNNHRQVTRNHLAATRELASRVRAGGVPEPDLVVWPENSTAVDPFTDYQANTAIEQAVAVLRRPLLVGAMVDAADPNRVLNQGVVWDSATGPGDRYTKRHPVPFGEYVPFRSTLGGLNSRLAAIPRDMLPGTASAPLEIAGIKAAMAICFDVAFDDVLPDQVRRGGELVIVQTSNAMFTGTTQPEQQFAISRLRALETGRSVVVASTNGISGVIGPDGHVIDELRTRGTGVLVADVPLSSRMTLAMRVGALIGDALIVLAAGSIVTGLVISVAGDASDAPRHLCDVISCAHVSDGSRTGLVCDRVVSQGRRPRRVMSARRSAAASDPRLPAAVSACRQYDVRSSALASWRTSPSPAASVIRSRSNPWSCCSASTTF